MKTLVLFGALLWASPLPAAAAALPPVKTVFVIVLENANWSSIKGGPSAPYINQSLLPFASYCDQYYCPSNNHPSLANYLWLEAGTNFGILNDGAPSTNHLNTTKHLVGELALAGVSWRAYEEDIDGLTVPLRDTNHYAARHDPFVYFDDVTGTNDPQNAYAIAHIRPYAELAGDLTNNSVARYNFITPNLIHDGHDVIPPDYDEVEQMDSWLASEVPKILQSVAYTNNGALFIIWDEGDDDSDGPIGLILLSPRARGAGYASSVRHTHSATLKTIQEIFGVQPWLGDTAESSDLAELFSIYSFANIVARADHSLELTLAGTTPGQTNVLQASDNLVDWITVSTNIALDKQLIFTNRPPDNSARFYRSFVQP